MKSCRWWIRFSYFGVGWISIAVGCSSAVVLLFCLVGIFWWVTLGRRHFYCSFMTSIRSHVSAWNPVAGGFVSHIRRWMDFYCCWVLFCSRSVILFVGLVEVVVCRSLCCRAFDEMSGRGMWLAWMAAWTLRLVSSGVVCVRQPGSVSWFWCSVAIWYCSMCGSICLLDGRGRYFCSCRLEDVPSALISVSYVFLGKNVFMMGLTRRVGWCCFLRA